MVNRLWREKWLWVVLMLALLAAVTGCSRGDNYKRVDFSKTITVVQPEKQTGAEGGLRVAVAAMISPKETFVYYHRLLDYIGSRLGRPVQLIQRKTYGEINALFPKREIDLAFICTGPYAVDRARFGFEALAVPVVRGKPFYRAYLIVNRRSPYRLLDDLKGRVFAFTDPQSNTGALVPTFWLSQTGQTPEGFFKKIIYTYSHDNSILAVARGLVDGAAVDSLKWEYYNRRKPLYTAKTRVIRKSKPFGTPPLVASRFLAEPLKVKIRRLLFSMHKDADGRQILKKLMIGKFIAPQEKWYTPVAEMYEQVHRAGKVSHGAQES